MDRKNRKTAAPPVNPRRKSNGPFTKVSRILPNNAAVPSNASPIMKRNNATLKESRFAAYLMRLDITQNAMLDPISKTTPFDG